MRYYDEIGLLVPTERTNAGYRLYDDKALEKLRAILFLRELDIPLDTMKEVVNAKNCDYGAVLKNYRKNIVQKVYLELWTVWNLRMRLLVLRHFRCRMQRK